MICVCRAKIKHTVIGMVDVSNFLEKIILQNAIGRLT